MPRMETECEEIMEIYHSWGHPGIEKTQEIIQRDFWWPRMKDDLMKYIKACQKSNEPNQIGQNEQPPYIPITWRPLGDHISGSHGSPP
jgi:hypothetical protein